MSTCTVRPNMNYYLTIKVGLEGKLLKSTNCLIAPLLVQYSLSLGVGTVQNDPSLFLVVLWFISIKYLIFSFSVY